MSGTNSRLYPNKNKDFDKHIVIDYPRATLNKNEVDIPTDIPGSFTVPYPNNTSENNFFYTDKGTTENYSHSKIYINKLIHYNIDGVTTNNDNIVGELIIEHKTFTNTEKLYTCYLLETKPLLLTDENDIDKMLKMKEKQADNLDIDFNTVIPNQEGCIAYESKGNKVCVFITPIQINTASKETINDKLAKITDLFKISPDDSSTYKVIPGNNISKRDAEEIYIDCNPTGVSEDEVNTYNVPINSKMASQSQESDYMKTTVNFGLFILTALVSYVLVPMFYKNTVIDTTNLVFKLATDAPKRFKRIRSADILIALAFVITISSIAGAGNGMYSYTIAMFISIFYIVSFALIQLKKTQTDFLTTKYKNNKVSNDYDDEYGKVIDPFDLDDIWVTIMDIIKFVFKSKHIAFLAAIMTVIATILGILVATGGIEGSTFGTAMYSSVGPLFVIINSIMVFKHNQDLANA